MKLIVIFLKENPIPTIVFVAIFTAIMIFADLPMLLRPVPALCLALMTALVALAITNPNEIFKGKP